MKGIQLCIRLFLFVSILLSAAGCKKIEQEILKDPCADYKPCNIKSYVHTGTDANTAVFTYDAYGNPLTVTNTFVGTGYPNLVFKYDAAHRLKEFYRPYSNGLFENWYKYVYDASGRIAFDTTFTFGTVTPDGPVESLGVALTTYTYDGTCRVIKTSSVRIDGGSTTPFVQTYSYDASGNLVRPGAVYDNKVNIHRTNKVFMFIDRDFSMNNPYAAASYNAYSFPQTIGGVPNPFNYFLLRQVDNTTFTYMCD